MMRNGGTGRVTGCAKGAVRLTFCPASRYELQNVSRARTLTVPAPPGEGITRTELVVVRAVVPEKLSNCQPAGMVHS